MRRIECTRKSRHYRMLDAMICPCGECGIDPASWECRECASVKDLEAAEDAYRQYIALKESKVRHA